MGSLSPQFYHHHHQLQEEEYYNSLSNSMRWWFHDDDDEEEEDNVEHLSSPSTQGTTGYLEDVLLFHYSNSNSKRRRLLSTPTPPPPPPPPPQPQPQDSWTWPSSNSLHNCCHSLPHLTHYCQTNTTDQIMKTPDNEGIIVSAETMEYQYSAALFDQKESSPSSHIIGNNNSQWTSNNYAAADDNEKGKPYTMFPPSAGVETNRKKRVMASTSKVVYPFALVKPRGFEGDDVATLNDINQRILMPPTRPVRHPVGDFACRPLVTSARGPGLSGKTVVAFTRVHTQGRGTITIIRTRG